MAAASGDVPPLSADTPEVELGGHLSMLVDPESNLGLAEVIKRDRDFVALEKSHSLGFKSAAVWFRVTLQRSPDGPKDWLLSVGPAFIDRLELFVVGKNGQTEQHAINGRAQPFRTREISYRLPVFRLHLPDDAPRTLYFRVTSRSALLLLPELWQPAAFTFFSNAESHLYGIYFGMLAALILVCLLFWTNTRELPYLAIGTTATLSGASEYVRGGFAFQYFLGDMPPLNAHLMEILIFATTTSYIGMLPILLGITRREHPRLWLTYAVMIAFGAAGTVLAILDYRQLEASLLYLFSLVIPPLSLAIIWRSVWLPDRVRAYFALALLLVVITGATLILGYLGVLPLLKKLNVIWQVSVLVQMVLFALGIADRYRQNELAKNAAQAEALASAQRLELELEGKVAERTRALTQTNEKLHRVATERRAALNQASEALAAERAMADAQRQFVTMASHEFRTPLAIIDAANQSLRVLIDQDNVEVSKRVDKITQAMARLKTLIDQTLSRERLEAGRLIAQRAPFELCAWLAEQARIARLMTPQHPTTLTIGDELSNARPLYSGDNHLLSVAWMNLVDNAAKFSPAGTAIHLGARIEEGALVLEVSDSGPGIPAADLPSVFDQFVRGRHVQGTVGAGLGLYMVRRIAELHGGTATIANTEAGCRATIRLGACP